MTNYENLEKNVYLWAKYEKQDNYILQYLSKVSQHEHTPVPEIIKHKTMFAGLTEAEIFNNFKPENFNNLKNKQLFHLLQEVYNTVVKQHSQLIGKNVYIDASANTDKISQVDLNSDILYVSPKLMETCKQNGKINEYVDAGNVGYYYLESVLRQAKISAQREDLISLMIGNKVNDKDREFSACMSLIANVNNLVAKDNPTSVDMQNDWYTNARRVRFEEFDNLDYAFNQIENNIDNETKKSVGYNKFIRQCVNSVLGMKTDADNNDKTKDRISTRIIDREDYVKHQLDYFAKNIQDCPLKSQVINVVEQYIMVDKNGTSALRTKITTETAKMFKVASKADEIIAKNTSNDENLMSM